MPSHYAHYRFGTAAIPALPPEVQRTIRQFRQMYEVGLQGPDIFFYHNILFKDNVVALGKKVHRQSGEALFLPLCEILRQEPNEAAMAYLWGLLTHYCLDSMVHPLVYLQIAGGEIGHVELETEFDRYLLQLDGKRQPNTFDLSPQIRLTQGECVTAATFYPGATGGMVKRSVKAMASIVKFLAMPNGNLRRTAEKVVGEKTRQHFMGRSPNKSCAHLNPQLLAGYEAALAQLPEMVRVLQAHMADNAPLGLLFEPSFEG